VIVLDTHAWVWYATESRKLSRAAAASIRRADRLGVHPISCWEVMLLVERARLRLTMTAAAWIEQALMRPKIEVLGVGPREAVRAAQLGSGFPGDPADRFIVASALELNASLVSRDAGIAAWGGVPVVW
jgi:PIN domain nuclease of toxin-antitoxin system